MKYRLPFFLPLFLFILMNGKSSAQNYQYSFEHYTTDNGMSHDNVLCLLKDHKGFMWFGTSNGLDRFDGYQFKSYYHLEGVLNSLPSNSITALAEDKYGKMWVSTSAGICRFDPLTNSFMTVQLPSLPTAESVDREATNIAFDREGVGWFVRGRFIYKINLQNLAFTRYSIPVSNKNANQLFIDNKNRIWMVLQGALYRFNQNTFTTIYYKGRSENQPSDKYLMLRAHQLSDGRIWFQTWGAGLMYFDEAKQQVVDYPDQGLITTAIAEDHDDNNQRFLWVGGHTYGLMRYDFKTNQYHSFINDTREPLSHNNAMVHVIYVDTATQVVWFGTTGGIEKYDKKAIRFRRILFPQDLTSISDQVVSAVIKDKTDAAGNKYWIGIWANGIMEWDSKGNTYRRWDLSNGLKNNEVFDLLQDKQGLIWIGEAGGIQVYDPRSGKFIHWYHDFLKTPFINHKVLHFCEDHSGNVWIKTNYEGVFEWKKGSGEITRLNVPNLGNETKGVHPNWMDIDNSNNLWLTTWAGLYKVSAAGVTRFFNHSSRKGSRLPNDFLGTFCIAKDQSLWVAGVGFLAHLDTSGEVKQLYNLKNGMKSEVITKLLQDASGHIWIATSSYLHCLDPATGQFIYFGKEDGLANNAQEDGLNLFNDGTLAIGFQRAFCMINTGRIPINNRKPGVQLTAVKLGSEEIYPADDKHITIHPVQTSMRLEFSSLNYTQPQKDLYAFKLDGFDKQWRVGTDRDYTVMNLPGGNHLLHIKARNNDGIWSDEQSIMFTVIPPFRDTWLFRFMVLAIFGGGVYLIYWYRRQSERKVDMMRNRIATDLHDDMGSTLSSIRILSEVASRNVEGQNPKAAMMLEKIKTDAAVLSENMQDIVWTIKTHNNSLGDVVTRMKEYALKVLEAKNIEFQSHIADSFRASKLNLAQRRNLYLVFKEIINNAVKYAGCSKVELFITQQGRYLKMVVEDDGCGFDLETIKKGNGLTNLQRRAGEVNGRITIDTKPAKGTRIDLLVKL
jgi:ligand-binding sensor domain-containing protein/two-component sensor histidine kinase